MIPDPRSVFEEISIDIFTCLMSLRISSRIMCDLSTIFEEDNLILLLDGAFH